MERGNPMGLAGLLGGFALVVAGCGGDAVGSSDVEQTGEHSRGWPILVGSWVFDHGDRCGDGEESVVAPGCFVTAQGADGEDAVTLAAIAGTGSTFTSDVDVTMTHRGGLVRSEPTGDPNNPERRTVLVFVDLTFPDSLPGEDDLHFVEFQHQRPDEFAFAFSGVGSGDAQVWPNGNGTYDGILHRPEPGETLTLAAAVVQSGPTSLLGEEDPTVDVRSSYTGNLLEEDRESGNTTLALVDQDPDADVLEDVRASIQRVVGDEDDPDVDGGLASFESLVEGLTLASAFPMDPDAATDPNAGQSLDIDTPPPPPEATAEGNGPFDGLETMAPVEELSPYEEGYDDGEGDGYDDAEERFGYDDSGGHAYQFTDPDEAADYERGYAAGYPVGFREGWREAGHPEDELPPEAGGPGEDPGPTTPPDGDGLTCTTDGPMAECY